MDVEIKIAIGKSESQELKSSKKGRRQNMVGRENGEQ